MPEGGIMKYETIKELEAEKFRRLTGVKRGIFEHMVEFLKEANQEKKRKGGRKNKLCIQDQLMMALEYLLSRTQVQLRACKIINATNYSFSCKFMA